MTNTELLQAISDLLDEKLEAKLQPMRADMQAMKGEVQVMKADMQDLKGEVQVMKADMQDLKPDIQDLQDEVHELQRKVAGIGMRIENCTDKNVQLLAENFIELTKKLNMVIPAAHNNYTYEMKVNYFWKRWTRSNRQSEKKWHSRPVGNGNQKVQRREQRLCTFCSGLVKGFFEDTIL